MDRKGDVGGFYQPRNLGPVVNRLKQLVERLIEEGKVTFNVVEKRLRELDDFRPAISDIIGRLTCSTVKLVRHAILNSGSLLNITTRILHDA